MSFNALVVKKDPEGAVSSSVEQLELGQLPEGEVTVAVDYSTLNYKDGLCLTGGGGLVRSYPHVPGIDFAGTVETSTDDRYKAGDRVVLTGWRVGEVRWGGYAQRARVKADWLVPLPEGISTGRRGDDQGTGRLRCRGVGDHPRIHPDRTPRSTTAGKRRGQAGTGQPGARAVGQTPR